MAVTNTPDKSEMKAMTDEQIKHMANRFLGWRLPESFNPDHGISFKNPYPHLPQHWPSGTNLFDAEQAEAMVRYMTEGLPSSRPADQVPEARNLWRRSGPSCGKRRG